MLERIFALAVLVTLTLIFRKRFMTGKKNNSLTLPENIFVGDASLPTVLYFWTHSCVQCKTLQQPVLQKLKEENGRFNLIELNAIEAKELTSSFNIRTVPSTVIFSDDRRSKYINNGFAGSRELLEQLEQTKN